MPKVAVVRLRHTPKNYWFDPAGIACEEGDHVVVQTTRGKEIGVCVAPCQDVDEKDVSSPLKPVLRIATDKDFEAADEATKRGEEAMGKFRELVEEHGLDMKPVRVEFMFSGDYATFYFSAEERVDFRSLVRDLASAFHVRVDMRQIGARDEARMVGGLGHCGEELCCCRMGGDFQPVSIRMAKEQDLPLNPSKISGLCGRLMCCLRYEFEAYKDFKGRAPKKNALIETPEGMAKVIEFDTPREIIHLRMEDGSTLKVPLSSMDCGKKKAKDGEKLRPCHIGQDAFDQIMEELERERHLTVLGGKAFSKDEQLADTVAEAGAIERNPRSKRKISMGSEKTDKSGPARRSGGKKKAEPAPRNARKRRRSVSVSSGESTPNAGASGRKEQQKHHNEAASKEASKQGGADSTKPKRRRRRGGGSGGSGNGGQQKQQPKKQEGGNSQQSKPRPGQNSSTLHGNSGSNSGNGSGGGNKRRRRRRGGSGNKQGGSQGGSQNNS